MITTGYNKIYRCEDKLFPTNCFICVGKDKCKQFRYGDNDPIIRIDNSDVKKLK